MKECQQSVEDIIVLAAQLLQLRHSRRPVVVLLLLVFLQCRLSLVNLSCETVVRQQNQELDVCVVSVQEVLDGLGGVGVEGAKSEVESNFLLEDPGESAFLDEDASGKVGK